MPSQINASNSGFGGIVSTGDSSGVLELQTTGTTAVTIDTSQRVGFVAGTAAAPAITRTGDTNTGMFFPAADTIAFSEGGAEAMRLDSVGNVGIGTTSPLAKLHVGVGADTPIVAATTIYASNNGATVITTRDSINDVESYIGSYSTGTWLGSASNHPAIFTTNNLERMRIDSSGKLVMASTTDGLIGSIQAGITANTASTNAIIISAATANGPYPIGARGESTNQGLVGFFNSSNTVIGSITKSGNNVAYNTSSDYRLKENIAPMTGALDKIAQLNPVTYTWKSDGLAGQGFIAHELQEVVPECVNGQKDAVNEDGSIKPQGIDTSYLVATLTAAIQEQQTIINDLKARIETLEAK